MDIIICEDDSKQRRQLESIIEGNKNKDYPTDIKLSTAAPTEVIEYIDGYKNRSFIYFLDIELNNDINGIELANIIRKQDPKGYIVFTTSHEELSLLTFEYKVQAMDYIIKSDGETFETRIVKCLDEIYRDLKKIENIDSAFIAIDTGARVIRLDPKEILFFETDKNHKIRLHALNAQIDFYSSIKEIEMEVPRYFYKVHRAYLVNTNNIKEIDKENLVIHMVNDEICYASKKYIKELLKIV